MKLQALVTFGVERKGTEPFTHVCFTPWMHDPVALAPAESPPESYKVDPDRVYPVEYSMTVDPSDPGWVTVEFGDVIDGEVLMVRVEDTDGEPEPWQHFAPEDMPVEITGTEFWYAGDDTLHPALRCRWRRNR